MCLDRTCCCLIAHVSSVWYLSPIHHTYWSSKSEGAVGQQGHIHTHTGASVLFRGVSICHSSVYTNRSSAEIYDCLFTFKPQQQPAERHIDFAWLLVSVCVCACMWEGRRRSWKVYILSSSSNLSCSNWIWRLFKYFLLGITLCSVAFYFI